MFYEYALKDKVRVPPEFFGLDITSAVRNILIDSFEGKVVKDYGLIVSIIGVEIAGDGVVIPGDGAAHYPIQFKILSYQPQVNNVVHGESTEIVDFGSFVGIGPVEGLIHLSQITNDFISYNKKTSSLSNKDSKKSLKKGDRLIAKVSTVSMKNSLRDIKIGLSMRPEGLGKVEWIGRVEEVEEKPKENVKSKFKHKKGRAK